MRILELEEIDTVLRTRRPSEERRDELSLFVLFVACSFSDVSLVWSELVAFFLIEKDKILGFLDMIYHHFFFLPISSLGQRVQAYS